MENKILNTILKKTLKTTQFKGVFCLEELLLIPRKKGYYVLNIASCKMKNGHFITIVVDFERNKNNVIIFDPLSLQLPKNILQWCGKKIIFLCSYPIQNIFTNVCSLYSIFFLVQYNKKLPIKNILQVFNKNTSQNDSYVYWWVVRNKLLGYPLKFFDYKLIKKYISKICPPPTPSPR